MKIAGYLVLSLRRGGKARLHLPRCVEFCAYSARYPFVCHPDQSSRVRTFCCSSNSIRSRAPRLLERRLLAANALLEHVWQRTRSQMHNLLLFLFSHTDTTRAVRFLCFSSFAFYLDARLQSETFPFRAKLMFLCQVWPARERQSYMSNQWLYSLLETRGCTTGAQTRKPLIRFARNKANFDLGAFNQRNAHDAPRARSSWRWQSSR